jgi:hypothetical protein
MPLPTGDMKRDTHNTQASGKKKQHCSLIPPSVVGVELRTECRRLTREPFHAFNKASERHFILMNL